MASKRETRSGSAPSRGFPVLPAVFGVVVVLLVVAVFLGSSGPGSEFAEVTVEGSLPAMPPDRSVDESAAGLPAPRVAGIDFEGREVAIRADGRPKAIVFLAHWCPHCQNEVPKVQAWLDATGGVDGVDLYSVATAMNEARPNYPPSAWLEREGWAVPVIRDDSASSAYVAYGAGGFPYWVFVDREGRVVLRSSGEIPIDGLQAILESLATG